ncbi:MAG: FIST C-terminal domain-containing protein [Candidatus Omnitrophica bacterium]|nr:FIST C-terminal domain-containing protein [Candidatus Omnitrophota bacterium]
MPTVIGTGISTKLDSFAAGKEAALNAYYQIGKNEPSILIIFISTIFDQEIVIKGVYSIIKDVPLIGCSSIGSISTYGSSRDSVTVFIISSNSIGFSCGIGHDISKNPRLAGHNAARQASNSKHNPKQAYIMLSDSLTGNNADILRGSQEALGTSFPIIGGGACDKACFQKTYQYMGNEIRTNSVAGVLVSGDMKLGIGKSSGWQPIGKSHKITKAKSNIVKEIDKKIAVELYEEYFEKSFLELKNEGICALGINYPLGVRAGNGEEYLTRVPLAIEENGSLVLNADIQEGEDISLMIGDKDLVLESAKKAVMEAMKDIKSAKIKFAVIFSDISRLLLLRKDAYKEIDIIKENIGKNTPILGCYTFGEYAPFIVNEYKGQCYFNNQSISIALFSE